MKRMLLAFLVSPIGPVLVQVVSFNLDGEYHPLAMFVVFSGLLYALQLVFVLPAYVAQHRRGQHQWWIYGLTGLLGTVIPMALLVLFGPQTKVSSFEIAWITMHLGIMGTADALIFWFIAHPRRQATAQAGSIKA